LTNPSANLGLDQLLQVAEVASTSGYEIPNDKWKVALAELAHHIHRPMSIAETERVEAVLKAYLRLIFRSNLSGDDARFLALWQRNLGFILKYKSYGVKCATPFGYSVFLQNPGEGFSFQRHLTRKTEVFLIIEPLDHALVFLCTSAEWEALYDKTRLQRWLEGGRDAEVERLASYPKAGDVYHVSELGVVHTVLGCVLEEFATVSTDMVDRLHDQNAGRPEPHVSRDAVIARLRRLAPQVPRMAVKDTENVGVVVHSGTAHAYVLATGVIEATRLHVERGTVELPANPCRVRVVFTVAGRAACELTGSGDALGVAPPAIDVCGGDLLMIPPGVKTMLHVGESAAYSVHTIEPEVALA
jgi:hypothetical protein